MVMIFNMIFSRQAISFYHQKSLMDRNYLFDQEDSRGYFKKIATIIIL